MSTKIHAAVDRLPVQLVLTRGQISDKTMAPDLLTPLRFTGDVVRGMSAAVCSTPSRPRARRSHSNVRILRSIDFAIYRNRNLIERLFKKLPVAHPRHRDPLQQARPELARSRHARFSTQLAQAS